jgi:hypothetical protein
MGGGRKVLLAVVILAFFVALSIPNLLRSRMVANEAALMGSLRTAQNPEQQLTLHQKTG